VIYTDLDQFAYAQTKRGFGAGDQVLIEIARRVAAAAPPDGLAVRYGGDEFAVFLPGANDFARVQAVAVALLRACDTPVAVGDATFDQRLSAGIAIAPPGDLRAGLVAADNAMYEAKKRGRARAVCLDPEWEAC